ncbi:hypothetical protein [uncultured Aquimarina sp.]|uniref:hypothetical protein n=1 Tax=uncultured Aquimarina sp. TaxID=575652 RepID=UPI002601A296|nr:hypothetical protein [uncultured Aquimarina sp.]
MKHFYLLIFAILIGPQLNSQTLVTKRFTPSSPVTVDGCGTYCTIPGLDPVTFTEADFPGMSPQVTRTDGGGTLHIITYVTLFYLYTLK